MAEQKTVFDTLSAINVSKFIEKKSNGKAELSYVSWANAWGIVKAAFPDASFKYTYWDGKPYLFDPVLGYLVEVSVTIKGETQTIALPVMDGANKAQKDKAYTYTTKYGDKNVEAATMFDINTSLQRCLVKCLALFGLGLSLYAGEDLPIDFTDPASKIDDIVKEVQSAKNAQELTILWNKYAPQFAKGSDEYKKLSYAVAHSPVNPSNNGTGKK